MDERKARNRMKPLSMLYVGLVDAFLYLPIIVVVLFSFNTSRLNIQFEGFTLEWYSKMFQNELLMNAFWNTIIVAAVSTFLSTTIARLFRPSFTR